MSHDRFVSPADRFLDHDEDGKERTREKTCDCGRVFTQSMLAIAFLDALRAGAREEVLKNSDGGFVPVECPGCERTSIGLLERRQQLGRAS